MDSGFLKKKPSNLFLSFHHSSGREALTHPIGSKIYFSSATIDSMDNDRRFPPLSGRPSSSDKRLSKKPSSSRSQFETNSSSSDIFATRSFQLRRESPLSNLDPRKTPIEPNFAPSDTGSQHAEEVEDYNGESLIDRRHLLWTDEMDVCLIDRLLEEKLKGQKISGSFTKTAYREAARTVSNMFNITCSSDQVKNRVKTLKKHLADSKDMLQTSGFGFNCSTGMLEAEGKVWETYLKAKPSHSYLRHTVVRNFEKLDEIFGKDRATGKRAIGPKQRQRQWEIEDTCDAEEDLNNEISLSSKATAPSGSSKQSHEKKRTRITDIVSEEIKSIKEGLDAVAAALDRGNIRNFSEGQLFEEIEKIGGMSEISQMQTYQNLTGDVGAARAFLACPFERRKLWLIVKYGSSLFDV